jgi:hypothetical protein
LDNYRQALDLTGRDKVVFCGDGAPWIGSGSEALCEHSGWPRERLSQVLDYTHAKQNLQELVELLPARLQEAGRVAQRWKALLWKGDLQGLYESLRQVLTGHKKTQALKKWRDDFQRHASRMQYARFREAAVPGGSGCVESAIRRVINLRLKAPGTFWTRAMAASLTRQLMEPLGAPRDPADSYELPQAA